MANICTTELHFIGSKASLKSLAKELNKTYLGNVIEDLKFPLIDGLNDAYCSLYNIYERDGEVKCFVESKWSEVIWPFFSLAWEYGDIEVYFNAYEGGMGYYVTNDPSGKICGTNYVISNTLRQETLAKAGGCLNTYYEEVFDQPINGDSFDDISKKVTGLSYTEVEKLSTDEEYLYINPMSEACVDFSSFPKLEKAAHLYGKIRRKLDAVHYTYDIPTYRSKIYRLNNMEIAKIDELIGKLPITRVIEILNTLQI